MATVGEAHKIAHEYNVRRGLFGATAEANSQYEELMARIGDGIASDSGLSREELLENPPDKDYELGPMAKEAFESFESWFLSLT